MTKKKETGWFSINRSIFDNEMWKHKPFARGQAWIDLIGLACHEDNGFWVRGVWIETKRGQIGISQKNLAKRWGWSRSKVTRFLKYLENGQAIEHQINSVTTVITILKYDQYQDKNTKTDIKRTSERHQTNTNNNDNNDNNDNKKKRKLPKFQYLDFVYLTREEHAKLQKKFGNRVDKLIDNLNTYGHKFPKKFKQYGSHYHVILSWNGDKDVGKKLDDDEIERRALERERREEDARERRIRQLI